ncbi:MULTISPECIES: acyl-CoA thioesterase [Aliiglaciecola]|uniref:acyl-CoA thioesterase n=1 Tax=Aliiglaciecola TaxID=1406885 RepID=UPI001C0A516C|nr:MULTISPECIES: acyl-CoA thioesterase [Aliiglaciecola]MBU2877321.1 acyl-CoA thioesterase [Aliiglaciecola lipolytica]MDO6711979.1 acyl-CoA thioesterase [Aliiglaciecola sp. 2_MG-2023]MDO6753657.1 acyl-CoA thioesterase [Aliiglaciecola sp. 1_MG-2023]
MSENSQTEFRFLAEPTDVNFGGKVHGGMVMKWIDQASYACAAQWSKHYCVTVSANAIRFIKPILVGQMVTVSVRIVHTGRTSMHLYVVVRASDPKEEEVTVTNRCFITFMAIDESGSPVEVPHFTPQSEEEILLEQVAISGKDFAKKLDKHFEEMLGWK